MTYASAMSSRRKPWKYGMTHIFKMVDEDEILLLLLALQMLDTILPTIFI